MDMSTSMIREMYCGGPEQGTNMPSFCGEHITLLRIVTVGLA